MIRALLLGSVLALAGCQIEAPDREASFDAAACEASGGTVTAGLAGPACARHEPDAGQPCSDSAQCSGICLAETRTCSPITPFFGCHELLMDGRVVGLCVD